MVSENLVGLPTRVDVVQTDVDVARTDVDVVRWDVDVVARDSDAESTAVSRGWVFAVAHTSLLSVTLHGLSNQPTGGKSHMSTQAPRWSADAVVRAAEGLHPLAVKHRAALEARLPAGFIDGLQADADAVRSAADDAVDSRGSRRGATVRQNDAIKSGARIVTSVRALVRTGQPAAKQLWREVGVGLRANGTVGNVTAGLRQVLNAAARFPTELRDAGVLQADLDGAQAALNALVAADSTQEQKKLTAKQATQALAATRVRLENNLMHLASIAAASLGAADARLFANGLPRTGKAKKAKAAPVAAPA